MADREPGLFESLWRMRKERKAREAMAQLPPEIVVKITTDAAGLNDPQPARGRSESLREFLQRTPHRYESDLNDRASVCMCGLSSFRPIHDAYVHDGALLDTHAYIAARLEEIRTGWPAPAAVAEDREAMEREMDEAEGEATAPDGVLGYLVAYTFRVDGGVEGVTHTTLMDLETARREAKAHGVSEVRRWFPVELREVSDVQAD